MLDLLFIFLRFSEYILTKKLGGNMKNKNRNHKPVSKNESPLDRTLRSALVALVITVCISALLVFFLKYTHKLHSPSFGFFTEKCTFIMILFY